MVVLRSSRILRSGGLLGDQQVDGGKPFQNRLIETSHNQSFCDGQSLTTVKGVDVATNSPDFLYFTDSSHNTISHVGMVQEDAHHN